MPAAEGKRDGDRQAKRWLEDNVCNSVYLLTFCSLWLNCCLYDKHRVNVFDGHVRVLKYVCTSLNVFYEVLFNHFDCVLSDCVSLCVSRKVVRRVSVNERSNLYRREHHKEAIVWQERGRQPEPPDDDEDRQTDAELNMHPAVVRQKLHLKLRVYGLNHMYVCVCNGYVSVCINTNEQVRLCAVQCEQYVFILLDRVADYKYKKSHSLFHFLVLLNQASSSTAGQEDSHGDRLVDSGVLGNGGTATSLSSSVPGEFSAGGRMDRSASYQLTPPSGTGLAEGEGADSMTREKSHHTLAELKRQRAAAKLHKHPAQAPALLPPAEEEPAPASPDATTADTQEGVAPQDDVISPNTVYFTPASGDPPLLKLRAPEEEPPNTKEPCCGLM